MNIIPITQHNRNQVSEFFQVSWGNAEMVISSGVYDCSTLDGFIVLNADKNIIGLITYVKRGKEIEIISLDSKEEGKGVGSLLINSLEEVASQGRMEKITVITTNDNLHALRFYQKRGYFLSKILVHAVNKARQLKPEIPLIGNDGIPIRDEIVLEKKFIY